MGNSNNPKMAKIGEGDPRWIVEQRADGANVNGWHWSATNVFKQAKQILEELIADEATNPELAPGCRISKVDKFTGDVHTNMRKGKCKLTYDLNIHFKWAEQCIKLMVAMLSMTQARGDKALEIQKAAQ